MGGGGEVDPACAGVMSCSSPKAGMRDRGAVHVCARGEEESKRRAAPFALQIVRG